jgi:antirestriction protein
MYKIYVSSVHDYNIGVDRGIWIDVKDMSTQDVLYEIRDFLETLSLEDDGVLREDWEVRDTENLPKDFDIYDLDDIQSIVKNNNIDFEIVLGYVNNGYNISEFNDMYIGVYDSVLDYAYEFLDDAYDISRLLGNLANYFNYEDFADDIKNDLEVIPYKNKVALFHLY